MEEDLPPPMWDLEAAWDDEIDRSIGPCEPEAPADRARMEKGEGEVTMRTRRGLVTVEMTHFRRYWFDPDLRGLDARVGTVGRAGVIKKAARMAVGFEVALRCESLREEAEEIIRTSTVFPDFDYDSDGEAGTTMRVAYPGDPEKFLLALGFGAIAYGCIHLMKVLLSHHSWDVWHSSEMMRASLIPLNNVILDHILSRKLVPKHFVARLGGCLISRHGVSAMWLGEGVLHPTGTSWFDEANASIVARLPAWVVDDLRQCRSIYLPVVPRWAVLEPEEGLV